jgi:cell division protein FtsN
MLEDLVKRQWQALVQFIRGSRFARKLSRQKPSLIVAIGKRRKVNALEEYRRRFASPADQGNHPSGLPLAGDQGFRQPPAQQYRDQAKQPERAGKAKPRQRFETGGRQRDMRLKAKVNRSGGDGHFFETAWTLLLLALLRGYHGVAAIKFGRNEVIAVTMGCAIALGGAYVYRTIRADSDGSSRTRYAVPPSSEKLETADDRPNSKQFANDRLTSGSEMASATPDLPQVPDKLAESVRPDNPADGPLSEGKQSGNAGALSQPAAAERQVNDQPTAVRSETYLPDGTRTDAGRPAPVPSIVRLGAGQVRPPFRAAEQSLAALPQDEVLKTNSAPAEPLKQAGAEPAPSSDSGYFAQVKSDQDQKAAEAELASVVDRYKAVLGEVPLITRSVDLKEKGVWFRVLAGPVKSRDEAMSLCKKLKSAGLQACIVQKFD